MQVVLCMAVHMSLLDTKNKRKTWVKKWREDRTKHGHMPLLNELRDNFPEDFKNYLRMDAETFNILLNLVSALISKQNTKMRESISAEERLVVTLRYLATGLSFEDLKFSSGISPFFLNKKNICTYLPLQIFNDYSTLQSRTKAEN